MSKSPFELRMDSLYFARDLLVGEYEAALTRLYCIPDEDDKARSILALKYPSIEEIYQRANELRSFVDGNTL